MWIFSRVGMFSVVEAGEPVPALGSPGEVLAVRARVDRDLDDLRHAYAPELGPTVRLAGRDYPCRAYISKQAFAAVMGRVTLDIDYSSFKSMVAREQGMSRAHLYSRVWSVMHDAERKIDTEKRARQQQADGGVADRCRKPGEALTQRRPSKAR